MKHSFLSFLLVLISLSVMAQVSREVVLVEVATGTGCPYCPGAAMGLDDLYANGDPVAGIEYHSYNSSDPFNTPEAAARNSWYGVTGYPTAQFDGEYNEVVGGSNSSSMYSSYQPIVNTRIAMNSNFTVELYGDHTGDNYDVVVRVTKESAYSGTNLKVRFALTETDIAYAWQGQTHIDYTERLMAPDQNGTPVSFTAVGESVDVNLSFTFNNTWVDSNCELIAWIQDDDNKFALQTTSVMLLNLQPDQANANFTQSIETTCEGSTVDFTDLSTGAITSWNWTFEGGTPATSTDENPSVVYNNAGSYDVTLEVSDGTTVSTLTVPDLIRIILPPVQPNAPTGDVEICSIASGYYTYTTDAVPNADSYTWSVSPASAGTITGTGTEGHFVPNSSYTGDLSISVRADNFCGNGTFSAPLACTKYYTPGAFMLSDGGAYCEGGDGIEVTQSGSENGMNYLLYVDDVYTGITVVGTGSAISYGFQSTEGIYTAYAETDYCATQMMGTPWIYPTTVPTQASQPAGESTACNTNESSYTTDLIDVADSYDWVLSPVEAGTLAPDGTEVTITWAATFSGAADLTVAGVNSCGTGTYSSALVITLVDTPEPVISGPAQTCDFTEEVYAVEDHAGNTYQWTVSGGYFVSGEDTHQVTVMWTNPGTGTIDLIESTPEDCSGEATTIVVTIDNCTGIGELNAGALQLYPNPVGNTLHLNINEALEGNTTLRIVNAFGQVVYSSEVDAQHGNTELTIETGDLKAGYYIVQLETEAGARIQQRMVKQ